MTPAEFKKARQELGHLWGYGRWASWTEMGAALRLAGGEPRYSVRDYERGRTTISGPISVAVEMMLNGMIPPDGIPQPANSDDDGLDQVEDES